MKMLNFRSFFLFLMGFFGMTLAATKSGSEVLGERMVVLEKDFVEAAQASQDWGKTRGGKNS